MFWKKFLLAAAAYVAWTVVATVFSEKKGEKVRAELKDAKDNGGDSKKILMWNFIETHKNFLEELKEMIVTDENKEKFNAKLKEVKEVVREYTKEWEKLIAELKEQGWEYAEEAKQKLEDQYLEKKSLLEELKWDAPEKVEKMKEKLLTKFDEMKKKI